MDRKQLESTIEKSLNRMRQRTLSFDVVKNDGNDDNRRSFTVSSETPDLRFILTENGPVIGHEILRHDNHSVDLSRFRSGANVLLDHQGERVVGVVEDARVTPLRKLEIDMRFSRNPKAQEVKLDVDDGIRKNVSIGYRVAEYMQREDVEMDDGYPVFEAVKWMPAEASFVGVPADASVGVGRDLKEIVRRDLGLGSMEDEKFNTLFDEVYESIIKNRTETEEKPVVIQERNEETADEESADQTLEQEIQMKENQNPTPADVKVKDDNSARKEVAEIYRLANQYDVDIDKANEAVERGLTPDQFAKEVLRIRYENSKRIDVSDIVLSEKEERKYDLGRAVRSILTGEQCFERDVSEQIAKRRGIATRGVYMPTSLRSLNANLGSTTGDGAEIVFEQPGTFIDVLREKTVLNQMGAEFMSGLTRKIAFPRQTAATTAYWIAEDPSSAVTSATMSLDQVSIEPKTLAAQSPYTRQLLLLGELDIGAIVRSDFARKFASAVEAAAIEGATNGPTGVISGSGVSNLNSTFAPATDSGSLITAAMLAAFETTVAESNADMGSLAFLTTPGVRGYCRVTPVSGSGGIASPIWTLDNTILGYPAYVSTLVPGDNPRAGGTDANSVVFGNWNDLLIAEFGAIEFIADEYTNAGKALVTLTGLGYFDVALKHPASFAIRNDIRDSL